MTYINASFYRELYQHVPKHVTTPTKDCAGICLRGGKASVSLITVTVGTTEENTLESPKGYIISGPRELDAQVIAMHDNRTLSQAPPHGDVSQANPSQAHTTSWNRSP